jgi:nucleoside-diphosphate-sugar epimerase
MKVFLAGATGVLGRRLILQFRGKGYGVAALARNDRGAMVIRALGGEPRPGDLFDADSLARAAEGAEIVIHAATSIPRTERPAPQDWAMNDRIRREGNRALTACAARIGARLYLQQSIVWVARPPDGSPFDEDSPPHPDAITQSALDGEQIAREAAERCGFRTGILRCGWFYASEAAHTRMVIERLCKRAMPILGKGDAVWACIHVDDAAGAFVAAAEAGRGGLWHVVDNELVTAADLLNYFAAQLKAPRPRHVPVWLARLLAGNAGLDFVLASTRTTNARFRRDTGWQPRFPTYREGLRYVASTRAAEPGVAAAGASE